MEANGQKLITAKEISTLRTKDSAEEYSQEEFMRLVDWMWPTGVAAKTLLLAIISHRRGEQWGHMISQLRPELGGAWRTYYDALHRAQVRRDDDTTRTENNCSQLLNEVYVAFRTATADAERQLGEAQDAARRAYQAAIAPATEERHAAQHLILAEKSAALEQINREYEAAAAQVLAQLRAVLTAVPTVAGSD